MDLSKLPKLSKTGEHSHRPSGGQSGYPPADDRRMDYASPGRSYGNEDEGPLNFLDIFLALGMGLLFIFLGMNYGKHLMGSKDAFPEVAPVTETGYVWTEGHPKAGQKILPEELSPTNREAYDKRVKAYEAAVVGRQMLIISESSLFLLGAGLVVAGLFGITGHLVFLPIRVRQSGAILGAVVTVAAMAYGVWAIALMLSNGITPPMTMVAVLVAGLSLFMQVMAVRALTGSPTAHESVGAMAGGGFSDTPIPARSPAGFAVGAGTTLPGRQVHHRFAHQTLRRAVFADPTTVVGVLQGAGGNAYLRDLWQATCHTAGTDIHAVPPTGLETEMTQVGPYSAAIVTMPPAVDRGEARFVGIVLRSYTRQDGAVIERSPLVLYYTLEVDPAAGVEGKGVLCEWQAGDHVKFADRVTEDFGPFREAMWAKVQARQEAEDRATGV